MPAACAHAPSLAGAVPTARTVGEALARASAALAAAGCATPRLDAEVLLAHALGVDRTRLLIDAPQVLLARARADFERLLARREREREPVAYITGTRAFRSIELAVDARALLPRPETELLVEAALALPLRARVLDVGTGSGAVALALKSERGDLEVAGSDVSAAALELARENAQALALRVRLLRADLLDGVPDEFDAILANLPYVAARERDTLAPEIVRHEPATALYGGPDGTELITALTRQLRQRPRLRVAALEVGAGQARRVGDLLLAAGFASVHALRDLAGIERVVIGEART